MKSMEQYAKEYQYEHTKEGNVRNVNDYSFLFEKKYNHGGIMRVEHYTVYLSWFFKKDEN